MSITAWIAVLVIIATIYCLIKRYETRLVLFTAGLFLCCISMKPMAALDQFAKSMTNASLMRCDGLCLRRYAHFLRSSSG